MTEKPDITAEELCNCLQEQYGIVTVTLDFLPIGRDTRAGVYRVKSTQGDVYFIKVKAGPLYEPTCLVPYYLQSQGIAAVVAPLPTKTNTLWAQITGWTVILYPYVEGESGWLVELSPAQWQAVGTALSQIHQTALPRVGFELLRHETFDPAKYGRQLHELEPHVLAAADARQMQQMFRSSWLAHQTTIHSAAATLATLATRLRGQSSPYVICHADLHQGNIIRDQTNRVAIIDWDDVMLAPKERDFLFTGEPTADAPFFQGYGAAEIDWVALTYYRWERFIQDVIECGQCVYLRDDVAEATRAEQAQLFCEILANGDEIAAANAAAAHMPTESSTNMHQVDG